MIDRSEGAGLSFAVLGHVALFGMLSLAALAPPPPVTPKSAPIEVSLSDDVALESTSPVPTSEVPAARLSPVEAPIEPETAPPTPVENSKPEAKPQPTPPKPAPAPDARPVPQPPKATSAAAAAKPVTRRTTAPTGRLDGIVSGLSDTPSTSKSTTPPAATAGPQVRAALQAEVMRQIKPRWSPPTGADSDQLRTTVQVSLNQDGSIASEPRVTQTGITDSNRAQAALHRERAIRAVKLAAPFKLPAQYYDAWKTIAPTLYEGL
ncbi:cell envelope biogenesis protein TolA [Sphingomonas sp. JC676]|uniref:TonB C-terminal domain-containing protein n=1 Tax=Sphingomonas sp. JC676 TaxID=2768065 RepID=UPI001657F3C4|nr:TonB C-terminal domain-containing protein [Sphingomonas sp. JC676]MBC9034815.1 cell envelope biogenesis protein TolA [Sphingomonas sp. JC676]